MFGVRSACLPISRVYGHRDIARRTSVLDATRLGRTRFLPLKASVIHPVYFRFRDGVTVSATILSLQFESSLRVDHSWSCLYLSSLLPVAAFRSPGEASGALPRASL